MPVDGPHTNAQPEVTVEDAELDQAIADLLTDIRTATSEHTSELARRLADLLDLRKSLAERRIAEINDLASRTDRAVHVLDDAASSADLMRRACEQIAELCSARKVVLSRFEENRITPLVAFSASTDTSPTLPPAFGLVPGSPEARALATNTVSSGDVVSEEIQESLGTSGFSTVPIVVDGRAAAFVHIDTVLDGPRRHAVNVVAEMLGRCFERVGLEARREHQERVLRNSTWRWNNDIAADVLPPPDEIGNSPSPTEYDNADRRPLDPLTKREAEVVRLILTGASNAAIATDLVITIDTVKSHVKRILRKLRVTNRAELIAKYQSSLQ